MSETMLATRLPRRRNRWTRRAGHRLLSVAVIAGWALMPLMPVLALAFTWFSGLS